MGKIKPISKGLSITELAQLATTDKRYQNLWLGLGKIDVEIQKFIRQIVEATVDDPKIYSVRTEYRDLCYSILLFNAERQAFVGYSLPMGMFLTMCQTPSRIEMEINTIVRKIILKFSETGIHTGEKINWVL